MAPGKHSVAFDFKYDGGGIGKGGTGTLSVDGKEVAQGRIPNTVPVRFSFDETFDVGEDTGTPVSLDDDVPFKFTGQIEKVVVSLGESKLSAAEGQETGIIERTAQRANQSADTRFSKGRGRDSGLVPSTWDLAGPCEPPARDGTSVRRTMRTIRNASIAAAPLDDGRKDRRPGRSRLAR